MGKWLELFDEEFIDDLVFGIKIFIRLELIPMSIFSLICIIMYMLL